MQNSQQSNQASKKDTQSTYNFSLQKQVKFYNPRTKQVESNWQISELYPNDPAHLMIEKSGKQIIVSIEALKFANPLPPKPPLPQKTVATKKHQNPQKAKITKSQKLDELFGPKKPTKIIIKPKKEKQTKPTNHLEEVLKKEIQNLTQQFVHTYHKIHITHENGKIHPHIHLGNKKYNLIISPTTLLNIKRSQRKEFYLNAKIEKFVKAGNFIAVKVKTQSPTLKPHTPKNQKPTQILEQLQKNYLDERRQISATAKTAIIGDKEYTSFFAKNLNLQKLPHRFVFTNLKNFSGKKAESEKYGEATLSPKNVSLEYDNKTGSPAYVFTI